ncbi:MAG: DNA mismatch repair protein MutS [Flavobacteriales bacterium]|nr:DNA mismatch repair protein MutS [Flavobacteriales bacterium]
MKGFKNFKIGDVVSVINDTLSGKVVLIDQQILTIESPDGFLYTFDSTELVLNKEWNPKVGLHQKDSEIELLGNKKSNYRSKKGSLIKEVDLHIHELIDSEKGMSNFDKLSLQLNTVRKELEAAIAKKQAKIIFIHGRGEGVLKRELRTLCSKYPVEFHDASYTEYGMGATEVIIFQNKK